MRRLSGAPFLLIAALILFTAFAQAAFAQAADKPSPVKTLIVISTKADDVDDSKIDDNIFKSLAARFQAANGVQVLDLKSALGPSSRLKDDQIKQMLSFPELIGQTDHVRRNLHADGLLISNVVLFGKAGKSWYISADLSYYDLRATSNQSIPVSSIDYRTEIDKDKFYHVAADEIINQLKQDVPGFLSAQPTPVAETRVLCNKNSKLFHLLQSHHAPAPSVPVEEMTRSAAIAAGYSPCLVCFPEAQKHLDPNSLEAMLGAETAGFIEYYYRVSNDPARNARLERIGSRIIADNGFTKRRYVFTALNSDEINAIAAPAGYVYVTTGMMDVVESDDELASVMAHEMAHVERQHGVQQYRRAQQSATLGLLVSILSGVNLSILSDFVQELVLRGYDRRFESEADRYGYMYARRTSYDPEAMFSVLGKLYDMELASNVKVVSWLRTHPKSEDRIKSVTAYKTSSAAASQYLAELGPVDSGLAAAVHSDELRYVDRIDDLKKYVETVKGLP